MDYNDNESEGQNLYLAIEESSKISSVLPPFPLPKFDFDDNLQGHIRFDSLVENDVFLGITTQEDNHWIEDYSRGSSEIVFSSCAPESCALPKHINVWSEETSTESVEILLKAVRQEEMVSGQNLIEEAYPDDQQGSLTIQMENKLTQDGDIKNVDGEYGSVPSDNVQGDFYASNQNVSVKVDSTRCTSGTEETIFSFEEVNVDGIDSSLTAISEKLNVEMKVSSDHQLETCDLVIDTLCSHVGENLPVRGPDVDSVKSSSQKVPVKESVHQDNISSSSLISSNNVPEDITDAVVEEQLEGSKINDENMSESTVVADSSETFFSSEIPPKVESSKVEHAVETHITNADIGPLSPKEGEVVTDDRCNEVAQVIEPAGDNKHNTVLFPSVTEIKHPDEGFKLLGDKPSNSHQRKESVQGLGIETDDVAAVCANTEPNHVAITQTLVQHSCVDHEDIGLQISSSIGSGSPSNIPSSMSHELHNNSVSKDIDGNINKEDTSGVSTGLTIGDECLGKIPVVCGVRDAIHNTHSQNENPEAAVHGTPPLPACSMETCREDNNLIEEDVHDRDQGVPTCKKEDGKLLLDTNEIHDDKIVGAEFNVTGNKTEQNVDTAAGSKPDEFTGNFPVVNAEDHNTKLASPCIAYDESAQCSMSPHNATPYDAGYNEQIKETESEVLKEPFTLKDSLEPNELASAAQTEEIIPHGSAESGGIERSDQPVSFIETSTTDVPKCCKDLSKIEEQFGCGRDENAEAPSYEEPMEIVGNNPSTVPVTSSTGETMQLSASGAKSAGPPESLTNVEASLQKTVVEKDEVKSTTFNSAVNASCQPEGSFTFDVRYLGGRPSVDSIKVSLSLNAEGIISTSGSIQRDPIMTKEISYGNSPVPGGSPTPAEHKTRRGSSRAGKGRAKGGDQVKEKTPKRQNKRDEKSSNALSSFGAGQLMRFDSASKARAGLFIPTSRLPDLNSSSQSSTLFQQPFTDLQQVQLRAQIFVYGSLIQGAAPDEACMASAFDGGRNIWEPGWRACVERLRGQISQGSNSETPLHLRSGVKGAEQNNSPGFPQAEVAGRSSNKAIPSVVSPAFPLSSSLWSVSTPSSSKTRGAVFDYQAASPLLPFQSPTIQSFAAHTPWPSQASLPVPWLGASQSSPFGVSTNYSTFPITEPVKLIPVGDTSVAVSSSAKLVQTTQAMHTGATTMLDGTSLLDSKKIKASSGQITADTRTRKRKKSSVNNGVAQASVIASPPVVSASVPVVANYFLNTSFAAKGVGGISLINHENSLSTPVVTTHYSTSVAVTAPSTFVSISSNNTLVSVGLEPGSHNLLNIGELSKDHTVLHPDGLKTVEEAKLHAQEATAHASEAVSHCENVWSQLKQQKDSGLTVDAESKLANAAAAVAAAACVAKAAASAANVALSAAVQAKQMAESAVTKSGSVTTVLPGFVSTSNVYGAPTEISGAREAARRRVEAASAASRHAENHDAILKAAELAAEAVSHTGKIVTMSDPFFLDKLVEAGPNNYWKFLTAYDWSGSKIDASRNISCGIAREVPLLEGPVASIKEGFMVEVLKDRGDQKEGWFSANIVSLKDKNAFVCYTELRSDEGSEKLKEWVSLISKDGEAPRVRIPHPLTSVQSEGTRKRRRATVKDYSWSVGDKVDAWVQDCWREGIVAEKNLKDTTRLGVHFPAQGETLLVKLWHIRPTLIWTDGQWIEWCRPGKYGSPQGDSPMEKRPKLSSVDVEGRGTLAKSTNFVETETSEEARLPLSANEKVFNISSTREDNKPSMLRTGRSVPDKGGSRVVFGVPKPGKKRKFMEVSKHYGSDRSTGVNVPNDSMKLAKFLTPHAESRGFKTISKADEDRHVTASKAKVPMFRKPPSVPSRSLARKDASSSRTNELDALSDNLVTGSLGNDDDETGEQNLAELGSSNVEETSGGAMVFSSQALLNENRKKGATRGGKSEQLNRGKLWPTSGNVAKNEVTDTSTSQISELRRSNRRIQPTSRLLEGLQSSLVIPKLPSSHDTSHRNQNKGTTRGNQ